jgi:hypothetical protein
MALPRVVVALQEEFRLVWTLENFLITWDVLYLIIFGDIESFLIHSMLLHCLCKVLFTAWWKLNRRISCLIRPLLLVPPMRVHNNLAICFRFFVVNIIIDLSIYKCKAYVESICRSQSMVRREKLLVNHPHDVLVLGISYYGQTHRCV